MIRGWHEVHFAACLLAAVALGCTAAPDRARAQLAARDALGPHPGGFTTTVRRPPTRAVTQPAPEERDPGPYTAAPIPDPDQALDPDDDPRRRPQIGRRPLIDGDLSWPPEPVQLRDGVLDAIEPSPASDGIDPAQLDTRDPEDIAAFERPAAGYEPAAFAVEFEPILDRRPARLFRFEPFDPIGIKLGSFTVFPEAELAGTAISNPFRSSVDVRRDVALEVRPVVRAVSGWRTHALELRATGLASFHDDFPSEDDRAWAVETRGRIDLTRRTNIEATTGYEVAQEARGSINAVAGIGGRTEIETRRVGLAFNHRFNRLAIQLRGSMTDADYAPVTTESGGLATNNERDTTQKEAALRATWSFKPELATFGEVAFNAREYHAAPADGIERDSTGERYRAGLSFGGTGRVLRGEASIGHGQQRFEDSRLPEIRGIIVDANLAWRASGLTSVLLTARSDVGESTLAGSGGALARSAGIEVRHAFRRHLIGTGGLRLTHQDYEGAALSEREIAATLGLEYYLNREVTLFGRYQHVDFELTSVGRNYNADELRVGMRVRR